MIPLNTISDHAGLENFYVFPPVGPVFSTDFKNIRILCQMLRVTLFIHMSVLVKKKSVHSYGCHCYFNSICCSTVFEVGQSKRKVQLSKEIT